MTSRQLENTRQPVLRMMKTTDNRRKFLALLATLVIVFAPMSSTAQRIVNSEYFVYVLSEAADKISLVRFGRDGARVDRSIETGNMPTDIDGPHGIVISPDKKFYYVSLSNGRP